MVILGNDSNNAEQRSEALMRQVSLLTRQVVLNIVQIEMHQGCTCLPGPKEISVVIIVRRGEEVSNDLDIQTKHEDACPLYTDETMEETVE